MNAQDATAEALFRLLFGRSTVGFGVIGVARGMTAKGTAWERHAFDLVEDEEGWVSAVEMLTRHRLRAEAWPFTCARGVLRGIGSGAFSPGKERNLRSWQSVVALVWNGTPTDDAMTRFVEVGGSVIASKTHHYGLLPLAEPRPLGDLINLTKEVATVLGAKPLSTYTSVPLPGSPGVTFVTDVLVPLIQAPVSGEEIALAGLRTQPVPGVTPAVAA